MNRTASSKYYGFIIPLCLLSAAIGGLLGTLGQQLHIKGDFTIYGTDVKNPLWLGALLGILFGIPVGYLYCLILIRFRSKIKNNLILWAVGTLLGIPAGLACAGLVHIVLMIAYKNPNFEPLGIGSLFGAGAGLALGLISSGIFSFIYKQIKMSNERT